MPITYSVSLPANGLARSAANLAQLFADAATGHNAYESSNNAALALVAAKFTGASANSALSVPGTGLSSKVPAHFVDNIAPKQNATANTVDFTAGYVMDTNRVLHQVAAVSLAFTGPAGGSQWVAVYANGPSSGAWTIQFVLGAIGGTMESPIIPVGAIPIAYVFMQASNTLILDPLNYVGAAGTGYFVDVRTNVAQGSGGGGGGGGSVDTTARTAAVILNGTSSTFTNGIDISAIFDSSSSLGSIFSLLRGGLTEAKWSDVSNYYIQPDINQRAQKVFGTNTVQLVAGTGGSDIYSTSVTITANGGSGLKVRTNTSNVTSPVASGTLGPRYLYADCNATGPGFTLGWSTSANPGTYRTVIGIYYLDVNGVLQDRYASFGPLGRANSNQVALMHNEAYSKGNDLAATLSTTTYAQPANMNIVTFDLPEPTTIVVINTAQYFWNGNAGGLLEFYAAIDYGSFNAPQQNVAYMYDNAESFSAGTTNPAAKQTTLTAVDVLPNLAAGKHTLTQIVKASGVVADLYTRSVKILLFGSW